MDHKFKLESFEGPLDLLLYLIKENEVDIYDIPIARITEQFLQYLEAMHQRDVNIAGEFILMAATLMRIKSRMLLPTQSDDGEEIVEEDPRFELVERLLEYKKYKEASDYLQKREEHEAAYFYREEKPESEVGGEQEAFVELNLYDLLVAFRKVIEYATEAPFMEVSAEKLSVEERIQEIEARLIGRDSLTLMELVEERASRYEIVVTFLAILELIRLRKIQARQARGHGEIRIFSRSMAQ